MRIVLILFLSMAALGIAAIAIVSFTDTYERPVPEEVAGYHVTEIQANHRGAPIPLHIWYPAEQGTLPELIAQNALFFGEHVLRDAPPLAGAKSLVVLSHGSGGNGAQLSWLAAALVRDGHIVIATDHPGTRSRDSDPHQSVQIWHRTRDLMAMIDALQTDAPLGLEISDDIAAMGYSLGGPAALHLAGLQFSKEAFIAYCAAIPDKWDCGWYNDNDVDFAAIDGALYDAAYKDDRVTKAIVVDTALASAMNPASIAQVDVPVLAINMANEGVVPKAMLSDRLAESIGAQYDVIPKAWHFSFLQECSGFGKFMIWLLSSDNICKDIKGKSRGAVHNEITEIVTPFLKQ